MLNDCKIKVSVIIPIYNMEKYLGECLESILNQTLKEIEIICVNDGSTDNSQNVIDKYSHTDSRIKSITKVNSGVSDTRNTALKIANGDYLIFMDPDDYYPELDVLETMYFAAIENHVDIVGGEFQYLNPNGSIDKGKEFFSSPFFQGYIFPYEGIISYADYQFDYGFTRFMYSRDLIMNNRIMFPIASFFEDPPFLVRALSCAGEFYALKKIVYCYRVAYKPRKWNNIKVNDMLTQMLANLRLADNHGYEKLYSLTIDRIIIEYREVFANPFFCTSTVVRRLWEVRDYIHKRNKMDYDKFLYETMNERERLLCEYADTTRQSISYKIGMIITYIPRMLRRHFLKYKR